MMFSVNGIALILKERCRIGVQTVTSAVDQLVTHYFEPQRKHCKREIKFTHSFNP
jgi:hypothetical protein